MTNHNPIIEQCFNYLCGRGAVTRESYEDVYKVLQWAYGRGVSDGKLYKVVTWITEKTPNGNTTYTLKELDN
ncbi:hypothetical protein [Alicyclobacillus acidoterrestris]|uniref:Uncharacterized protein n=1 Tax=Alicyclobacillus acidoterrestris (strain ATCC 49025 / DSM 3922 / CIP 106132 / NCIMB 13137 / GD3B) TaxID=1356854 RepID=T0BUE9_ALIAG|nr:hypothetical protein [Alicyclobacillus acidoterrestris]EPZ47718.1 hypothetical protein N007_05540 [Alicyclobacillus acidoterrestris ATCC 49025]UNO47971.1 hypothetical protein K1I37_14955 [Alicyclobacillus acidoterrestris]